LDGGALGLVGFDALDPPVGGFGDRDALARRGMRRADADIGFHLVVVGVGILFALEGLYMPLALIVGVIDDKRFLPLAEASYPHPLPYRHRCPPYPFRNHLRYVAVCRKRVCLSRWEGIPTRGKAK